LDPVCPEGGPGREQAMLSAMRAALLVLGVGGIGRPRSVHNDPRRDLPGMKRDAFDDLMHGGPGGGGGFGGGPGKKPVDLDPVCPEGDGLAPFPAMVVVDRDIFVRTKDGEECLQLLELGTANVSHLVNTARLECGRGWKEKLVAAMSVIFQRANEEWPVMEGESKKITALLRNGETGENTTVVAMLTEENKVAAEGCWKKGCGCAQTRHPKMTIVFYTCAALMLGGLLWDSGRLYMDNKNEEKRKEEKRKRKEERRAKRAEKAAADAAEGSGEAAAKDAEESPNEDAKEDAAPAAAEKE